MTLAAPVAGDSPARQALIAGTICYVIWGFLPLAFQAIGRSGADPVEIVAHRGAWSVLWAGGLVLLLRQTAQVAAALRSPVVLGWLGLSTVFALINAITYVIAVNGGRALDASLAYYLSPMLNMAIGAWLFKERVSRMGLIAIALAGVGVVFQAVALGHLPWVSLLMGVTFCGYGVVRKRVEVEAVPGLLIESLFIMPLGFAWILWLAASHAGHFSGGAVFNPWLLAAAPVTVVPTAMFAWAARRMPFSTLGFLQFIAPTLVFVIGVLQGEPFGWLRAASFAFIWVGAAVYALSAAFGRTSSSAGRNAAAEASPPEIMP